MMGELNLTEGQRDALAELRLIEAQQGGLRVESWRLESGWLVASVALDCRGIRAERKQGGLALRDREFMSIHVPPSYPLKPPGLSVCHTRFAGYENVMRGGGICAFRSPDTEWDPSDGMAVFVRDRVWGWLRRVVRDEVEQHGGVFHAPVRHELVHVPGVIRYEADEPPVEGVWSGYARIRPLGRGSYEQSGPVLDRFALDGWSDRLTTSYRAHVEGAALLLPKRVGFYFPKTLGDLLLSIERMGIAPERVVEHLGRAARRSVRGTPLFLVIGVPLSRDDESAGGRKHRLTTLIMAEEAARLIWDAGGTRQKEAAVAAVLERADELEAYVLYDRDARPGIVQRRDGTSPAGWFEGKTVAIWGAGALGGPIAVQLARASIGKVILRDNGYVHAGLLVRQPYRVDDEEVLKVDALRYRLLEICPDLEVVVSGDDLRGDLSELEEWRGEVDLVVNAAASGPVRAALDLARTGEEAQRVPVLTVGLDGRAERAFARLLMPGASPSNEELERDVRIAIGTEDALASYADAFFPAADSERREPFFPEPGCSDATFVGSAADMAALSGAVVNWAARALATEGEEAGLALLAAQPHVVLESGEPAVFQVRAPSRTSLTDERKGYTVRLGPGVREQIEAHITDAAGRNGKRAETGGPLWGSSDGVRRVIWVDAAGPAPTDSQEALDRFVCGVEGLAAEAERLREGTLGATEFVGTWHTHPSCPPVPSARDRASMAAVCARAEPLPRRFLMVIVGSPQDALDVRAHVFLRDEYVTTATTA